MNSQGAWVTGSFSLPMEGALPKSILTALSSIGGEDKDIVALILLNGSDTVNVTNLAPAIRKSEPILLIALSDSDAGVRAIAANMLGALTPDHPEMIGPLIKALGDREFGVYLNSISSLGNARIESETVVPALCRMLGRFFRLSQVVEALRECRRGGRKSEAARE